MRLIETTDPRYPELLKMFENEAVTKKQIIATEESTSLVGKTKKERRIRTVTHKRGGHKR